MSQVINYFYFFIFCICFIIFLFLYFFFNSALFQTGALETGRRAALSICCSILGIRMDDTEENLHCICDPKKGKDEQQEDGLIFFNSVV